MMTMAITFWALAAPMGYLAGDIFVALYLKEDHPMADGVPWVAAAFPPLGAVLAVVVLFSELKGEEE